MTRADVRRAAAEAIAAKTREEGGSPRETAEVASTPAPAVPPSSLPTDRPPRFRAPDGVHTPRKSFRVSDELWDAFQQKARENGLNGSEVLRMKMEEYVS